MTSFVRGIALLGLDPFLTAQGLDPRLMLELAGLPVDARDGLIPGTRFNALLEVCAERSGNPLFGLQYGLSQGAQGLGDLAYVIRSTGSVGEALNALVRCLHTHSDGAEIRLENREGVTHFLYDVTDDDITSARQTVELAIGMGARIMQSLLGNSWKPAGLLLRHSAGGHSGAYRSLLGVTPRFDCPMNAWLFDASLLEVKLDATDERFHQLMQQHIDELSRITLAEVPAYVQKLLRNQLPTGQLTLERIAEHMLISPRTLQRYLRAEGTGFQELLDKTRKSMATRYLCDSSVNLTRLAELLGYADLSAFSRAFDRWYGVGPQQWRQLYRQGRQPMDLGADYSPATARQPKSPGIQS
ncbi:AraC family transcriptional regulator [Pseudomonas sp. NY15181]|uniref:AraC-like transcriptional regulator QhpR n=1 Tax=Pseudomonas TaxID=286 RepID=UPI00351CCD29